MLPHGGIMVRSKKKVLGAYLGIRCAPYHTIRANNIPIQSPILILQTLIRRHNSMYIIGDYMHLVFRILVLKARAKNNITGLITRYTFKATLLQPVNCSATSIIFASTMVIIASITLVLTSTDKNKSIMRKWSRIRTFVSSSCPWKIGDDSIHPNSHNK